MSDLLYEQITFSALDYVQSDIIKECAIGPHFAGVRLNSGVVLAYMNAAAWDEAQREGPAVVESSLQGLPAAELIRRYPEESPLQAALGLAAINAALIHRGEPDPLTWFRELKGKKRLGMVGYFCPIMDRISLTGIEPVIFELRDIPGTHRPEEAPDLLPDCDVVLLTGASLVNKSMHYYLPHIAPGAEAFIFGQSTPLSDALLTRFTLGSVVVENPEAVFAALRAGTGRKDIKHHLRKVLLRRRP